MSRYLSKFQWRQILIAVSFAMTSGGARKKSWGGPLKLAVEKLFKASQNRPIIELFKFFGWATTSHCGNLDQPKPKTDIKLYKISQSRPIIVDFLIFPGGPWPTPAHEGLLTKVKDSL